MAPALRAGWDVQVQASPPLSPPPPRSGRRRPVGPPPPLSLSRGGLRHPHVLVVWPLRVALQEPDPDPIRPQGDRCDGLLLTDWAAWPRGPVRPAGWSPADRPPLSEPVRARAAGRLADVSTCTTCLWLSLPVSLSGVCVSPGGFTSWPGRAGAGLRRRQATCRVGTGRSALRAGALGPERSGCATERPGGFWRTRSRCVWGVIDRCRVFLPPPGEASGNRPVCPRNPTVRLHTQSPFPVLTEGVAVLARCLSLSLPLVILAGDDRIRVSPGPAV